MFRIWTAFAVAAGVLFGLWVELRGALGAPILAHVLVNGVQLARLRRLAPPAAPARPTARAGRAQRFLAATKYSLPRIGRFSWSISSSKSSPLPTRLRLRVSTTSSGERS